MILGPISFGATALDLGFDYKEAQSASETIARELAELTKKVAKKEPATIDGITEEERKEALSVDEDDWLDTLDLLRELGSPLFGDMFGDTNKDLKAKFKYHGFFSEDPADDPALAFNETDDKPILWEMMYEGSQGEGEVEWKRFWGFRVPISHWMNDPRIDEIDLKTGLFSAVHEELDFAGKEVFELQKQGMKLDHRSLASAFEDEVKSELLQAKGEDQSEVNLWWAQHKTDKVYDWLQSWLDEMPVEEGKSRNRVVKQWKINKLKLIFGEGLDKSLIHFACHCDPSDETEFLTKLRMKVGGEPISLNVSLMSSDLSRPIKSFDQAGPMVFLNACTTGTTGVQHEPPGFPKKWIKNRGALAVIATICPVPDYFAYEFAKKFYETLFQALTNPGDPAKARNASIAEALLVTRRHFMEKYNNPLGLAYVLYAFPGTYVWADLAQVEGDE